MRTCQDIQEPLILELPDLLVKDTLVVLQGKVTQELHHLARGIQGPLPQVIQERLPKIRDILELHHLGIVSLDDQELLLKLRAIQEHPNRGILGLLLHRVSKGMVVIRLARTTEEQLLQEVVTLGDLLLMPKFSSGSMQLIKIEVDK